MEKAGASWPHIFPRDGCASTALEHSRLLLRHCLGFSIKPNGLSIDVVSRIPKPLQEHQLEVPQRDRPRLYPSREGIILKALHVALVRVDNAVSERHQRIRCVSPTLRRRQGW